VNPAQLLEALARALLNARRDPLEVPVMRQEDAVFILRNLGNDGVRRVGWENIAKARNRVPASLEELASRLRDIVIRKEPQLWSRVQAASFM
jgi:hypothetical protein